MKQESSRAISRLIENKTVLIIAHKLRTVAGCDKIVVLEQGNVAEEGTHDALMKENGLYHRLYTLQNESLSGRSEHEMEVFRMNKEKTNRLNGKDLINIGIFTAVYFILNLLIAAAMGFIPIVNMMIPFVSSLVLGIPMMLYFSKIKKFGMVLITYIIYGVILTLAGVGFYSLIGGTLCAVAAEFILKAKQHKSVFAAILSYAICSVGANANVLSFALMTEAQFAEKAAYYGQEYMDIMSGYFSHGYTVPLVAISAFIGGIIGGYIGKAVLKKHFAKSGII